VRRVPLASALAIALVGSTAATLAATAPARVAGNSGLIATYTTTQSWGGGFEGQFAITNATNATVNVMAMDYGDSTAPNPAGKMGAYAIQSAQSTRAQIASVWPSLSTAQTWAMVGVTPMIGQNDASDEVFGLSDAHQLISFAEQNHLSELGFWAVTWDQPCTGSGGLSTCTEISQTPYQFSKLFAGYTG